MKLKCFSVYDDKAHAYITPFFLPETDLALRTFSDCVNDPNHQWGKHPEDYTLFGLGSFDVLSGKLSALEPSTVLANGLTLKRRITDENA